MVSQRQGEYSRRAGLPFAPRQAPLEGRGTPPPRELLEWETIDALALVGTDGGLAGIGDGCVEVAQHSLHARAERAASVRSAGIGQDAPAPGGSSDAAADDGSGIRTD